MHFLVETSREIRHDDNPDMATTFIRTEPVQGMVYWYRAEHWVGVDGRSHLRIDTMKVEDFKYWAPREEDDDE